jgi:hypothetical protein
MSEIKLRANVRIGELVRELETVHKAGQGEGEVQLPSGGKLKSEAIAEAGLPQKREDFRFGTGCAPRGRWCKRKLFRSAPPCPNRD